MPRPRRDHGAAALGAGTADLPADLLADRRRQRAAILATRRSFAGWLRLWGLHVEIGLAYLTGVVAALALQPRPLLALSLLAIWLVAAYHRGRALTTPLTTQMRGLVTSALVPLSGLSVALGFGLVAQPHAPAAVASVTGATAVAAVCRAARWRLQAPVRVLLVGDAESVARGVSRWSRTAQVSVVGGLVPEGAASGARDVLGVPLVEGLDAIRSRVRAWRADLVLVTPGPSVGPEDLRRLTWALEETRVAVGVTGVFDAVAAQRITPGALHGTSVLDVRAPRASGWVRGLKAGFDRLAGGLLLVLAGPLLLGLVVAVKLDSRGPALFRQTRIGQGGRPFEVYKLRTMVADAEEIKARLADSNEFDSVLFKMKRDPRVTRVGGVLRRTSLDELPQLLNVVRGEMSLVGPRPFVPDEVARMDPDALRRHVVKPGITGLWQVSGRSDLAWHESAALDTYYADNWTLVGDLAIGARTVKAVVSTKGAY